MARYEGMDDLIQRLQSRLEQPTTAREEPRPLVKRPLENATSSSPYGEASEHLLLLLRDAQKLREWLTPDRIRLMTPREHDDLLSLLGQVLQELWGCELALQRVAPYD